MAIFKIFPEKDSTIIKKTPTVNAGRDPIVNLGIDNDNPSRMLVKYSNTDLVNILNKVVEDSSIQSFKTYIKYYVANASNIPTDYTVEVTPISGSWDVGTGMQNDNINPKNGVSWDSRGTVNWDNAGGDLVDTEDTLYLNYIFTQSFQNNSNKDLTIDISPYIGRFYNSYINVLSPHYGLLEDNGFLINIKDDLVTGSNSYNISYFSSNTHTIYPPHIEIRWNDVHYNTGSLENLEVNKLFTTNIQSDTTEFSQNTTYRFNIHSRETHPVRTFSTSSLYLENKILPPTSYYALYDVKADIVIIDFDEEYTKISCDESGNFFNINMNGLQPERYYKILIKYVLNGKSIIKNNNYIFKINK